MATLSSKTGLPSFASSASGSGEINVISNPSAANDTTGWTGVTKVTSGSPLSPAVSTAFSIANTATSESSTSGGYFAISSMPTPLRSYKLKVEFWFTTPATDVYRVSVYAGSTRLSLSSDSSSVTTLTANTTAKFSATFDSTTAAAYSINITRTSGSTGACVITNVVVGPGVVGQGAAASYLGTYTPVLTSSGATGLGLSGSRNTLDTWRVGDILKIRGTIQKDGSSPGGTTSNTIYMSLPSGLTSAKAASGEYKYGTYSRYTTQYNDEVPIVQTGGGIAFTNPGTTSYLNAAAFAAGFYFYIDMEVPIAEWGSGTVNLGAGAQVEYLSTVFSSYVPDRSSRGTALPTTTPTGTAEEISATSSPWQYPQQSSDVLKIEIDIAGNNKWGSLGNSYVDALRYDGTNYIGLGFYYHADGSLRFYRGKYATGTSTAWSTLPAGTRFRLVKANPSAPVGFGMANANESGLIKPRKGQTALTVTSTAAGWSTIRAVGVYYQDQDGNHRLKFNIFGSITSKTTTSENLLISGVVFKNISGFLQPCSAWNNGSSRYTAAVAANNSDTITLTIASSTSTTSLGCSGDVELESKPTWA